jgi:hypothetical protein
MFLFLFSAKYMTYDKWPKVLALVAAVAKKLRAKNPKLSQTEATKLAWQTEEVLKAKAEYKNLPKAKPKPKKK